MKTSIGKLDRQLKKTGYSDLERKQYGEILEAFHQVYTTELLEIREKINGERLQQGKGKTNKPYPNPTEEQLKKIARLSSITQNFNEFEILEELKKIARIIRIKKSLLFPNLKRCNPIPKSSKIDRELKILIYQQVKDNLFASISLVVDLRIKSLLTRKKPQKQKAAKLIAALRLFHCQQYSMGEIASIINFSNQSKVSRLLKLNELREDVSRYTIAFLKKTLTAELSSFVCDPERLSILDATVQEFLEGEIKEIMDDAKKEVLNSQNRTRNSLFARIVCECVQQRGKNNYEC